MLRRKKELWILKENVPRGRLPYSSWIGKDSFNAESNSRFSCRFSMEAQTEKRIDNPRFIYPYYGLAIRLLLSGGKKRLINIALLRVYNGKSLLAHRQNTGKNLLNSYPKNWLKNTAKVLRKPTWNICASFTASSIKVTHCVTNWVGHITVCF